VEIQSDWPHWSELGRAFGPEFLAYVFGAGDLPAFADLTPDQRSVVQSLSTLAVQWSSGNNNLGLDHLLYQPAEYEPALDTSWANEVRQAFGGEVPDVPAVDSPLEAELIRLARDMYPAFLIRMRDGERSSALGWGGSVYRHPSNLKLMREFVADDDFRMLFPELEIDASDAPFFESAFYENEQFTSHVIWSDGRGGTLSLNMIPDSLLQFLFVLLRLKNGTPLDIPYYAQLTLETSRGLARRVRTDVPLIVALGNVHVSSDVDEVDMTNGVLISAEGRRATLPFIRNNSTAILNLRTGLKLMRASSWDPSGDDHDLHRLYKHYRTQFVATSRQNDQLIDRARLAMLLASSEGALGSPQNLGFTTLNPLAGGGMSWAAPLLSMPPLAALEVSQDVATRTTGWTMRVQHHPENLWLGTRRLLAAATTRSDALDGFIDAVICWENMFGTGEGETTFRVCASLATVLQPEDPEHRHQLFKELQGLYRERSKLVHGAAELEPERAHEHRLRAIELAVEALRRLYDRPDLLAAQDSSVRGKLVLLGG
jgi:hypothetical protein